MYTTRARNVNDAFFQGLTLLNTHGVWQDSRAGRVLAVPSPVVTVYENPLERVLFHTQRDANPVFHLMEALWMLAGRNDARWLDQFVGDFSSRFAESDGTLHGAYGYRWRKHFDMEGGGRASLPDQLSTIIELLRKNPDDRRIVLQMWDPVADLGASKKDVPCNTQVYFRVRNSNGVVGVERSATIFPVLDITVCCRSNDAVWGAYGSNMVHFSILQEYVAAKIGVGTGEYFQFSNNFHVYADVLKKLTPLDEQVDPYGGFGAEITRVVSHPEQFDADLEMFFSERWHERLYTNSFFNLAVYLRHSYIIWRSGKRQGALDYLRGARPLGTEDWLVATLEWYMRRMLLKRQREGSDVSER